ncbi:hypothetical protein TSAR_008600 [Trichomalopsis sarcophagae]|uniref:Uncharacterized protein n=1 Tax=Trichomalopsis sarcophagae TaxID=543379 RepID=A0A232F9C3_9HYME|nr:hypothetical protein TSAR_008600 [Trichomalopsis sarcophagae]
MSRDESRRSKRCRADRDYEMGPATGIMVNDYDDERTLDEEEALEGSEDTHNELSHLQKESDMPLKDLLVMYNYRDISCQDNKEDEDEDEEDEEDEEEDDEDEDDDDPASYESDLKQFYTEIVKAEENGANVRKSSVAKSGDPARRGEAAALIPAIDAHTTSSSADPKVEDSSGVPENTSGDAQNAGSSEVSSTTDNVNSTSATAGNVGSVGGGSGSSRLLRSVSRPQSEEEEDDCDYSPDDEEEWKKTIMVGQDYQAAIPEGLCRYDDALPYENEDKMLWDPCHINEEAVEEFLEKAQLPVVKGSSLPSGSHVRDDEQALYLLLQCGYNLDEALRRRRMNVLPPTESVSLWSEEECHNFETGLRNYGKDFHLIQKNKVRTRSVGELVQFYYLWKKTERHDIFTYKARLEKKKYALHPGITDYMDRFLEEQEGVRDRSSSPNVHCLMLYGDAKRQRTNANSTSNEEPSCGGGNKSGLDSWDGATTTNASSTTTTTSASGTTTGCTNAETSPPVNASGHADPLALEHLHNSSLATPGTGQLDYAKASSSSNGAGAESSSGPIPWPTTINANVATTIPSSSSSSSSSVSSSTMAQQQPQRNHMHHHMQQQLQHQLQPLSSTNNSHNQQQPLSINPSLIGSSNSSNDEAAAAVAARSPENILPHLPP